jgi:endoglucanase
MTLREDGSASLGESDIAEIDRVVQAAERRGLYVVLDLHEFGILNGIVSKDKKATALFAALWKAVAEHYIHSSNVVFGLMNEPSAECACSP